MIEENEMIKKCVILVFVIGLFSFNLWPSVEGKIQGIVTDSSGNPLEKVEVMIVSVKASSKYFTLTTDKNGKFTQVGLWPGYYQVTFKKEGFSPFSKEVKVSIAEWSRLEVIMEKTEAILERTLSDADRHFMKGYKLYAEKKYQEAADAYQEAIKLSSTQWGYYLNLGLAYRKMDREEEALVAFQKAVELNPESYSSNKELGEILAKSDNYEEAKKHYQKASELSPDDPDAFYNLGVCLTNLGQSEGALEAFLKSVELKDDYADAYYHVGTIYIGQNRVEDAVENLEKFLELAPEHEKANIAQQLLDYLKKQK